MLKFTERPKTPEITSKKNMAFPHSLVTMLSLKGISCLQLIFVLIWMKQTLIWFNLQRHGTGNGLPNLSLHQKMRIFKAGLSSSYDVGQNIKKKYLVVLYNVSDPNQNVETIYNSKLKFT